MNDTAGAPGSVMLAALLLPSVATAAGADELCGRPKGTPQEMYERLSKVEKLREIHRDQAYLALHDQANATTWTFTVAGHPAHPSVVCRRPVQDGDKLRLQMDVVCSAVKAECDKLVGAFQVLNERMIGELERQQKK